MRICDCPSPGVRVELCHNFSDFSEFFKLSFLSDSLHISRVSRVIYFVYIWVMSAVYSL